MSNAVTIGDKTLRTGCDGGNIGYKDRVSCNMELYKNELNRYHTGTQFLSV